jgi:hypothetical protein
LFFKSDTTCIDTLVMREYLIDAGEPGRVVEKAKAGTDSTIYFIHSTTYAITDAQNPVNSKITFYDAQRNKLIEVISKRGRNISYDLSNIHDSLFVVTTRDNRYSDPAVCVIKGGRRTHIIKEGDWQRLVSYKISPNNRYFLFHTRNPYYGKTWDYIYFYDLDTEKNWEYLFPTCLSCKKGRIELEIDDKGRSEVIHRLEHRVFSSEGVLEDIYLKLQ